MGDPLHRPTPLLSTILSPTASPFPAPHPGVCRGGPGPDARAGRELCRLPRQLWGSRVCPRQPRSRCGLSFQACRYGHVQHLEHLLFYGADMGAQNASGNTALHVCALYNQVSEPACAPHPPRLCTPRPGCAQRFAGGCPVPAAVMKPHRRGGLNSRCFLPHSSGCTSQTKGPPCLVPGQGCLPTLGLPGPFRLCPPLCIDKTSHPLSLLPRMLILSDQGPTLTASFNLITS